jgi:hypothetical protein
MDDMKACARLQACGEGPGLCRLVRLLYQRAVLGGTHAEGWSRRLLRRGGATSQRAGRVTHASGRIPAAGFLLPSGDAGACRVM